jgi:hypothetical protein
VDEKNKIEWTRNEKHYYADRRKQVKNFFKNLPTQQAHSKYTGSIKTESDSVQTTITFDSLKVHLSGNAQRYKQIFSSGLLSELDIFCSFHIDCKPSKSGWTTASDTSILNSFYKQSQYFFNITTLEELKYIPQKPTRKRFLICIPDNVFTGMTIFFLELTNPKAKRRATLDDFIKGATVTYFERAWGEI